MIGSRNASAGAARELQRGGARAAPAGVRAVAGCLPSAAAAAAARPRSSQERRPISTTEQAPYGANYCESLYHRELLVYFRSIHDQSRDNSYLGYIIYDDAPPLTYRFLPSSNVFIGLLMVIDEEVY